MSKHIRNGNKNKNRRFDRPKPSKVPETDPNIENSDIIKQFKVYAKELDDKHDRHERLVKLSRDITIESKRIIFQLHSRNENRLEEAEKRIQQLLTHNFKLIAGELQNQDQFLYHKAFTAGVQEFVEAATFYSYLKNKTFNNWLYYDEKLVYEITNVTEEIKEENSKQISMNIIPVDYILGVADLTGELMRKCINALGEGNTQDCYNTCGVVRQIYCGFISLGYNKVREISQKIHTLRNSLLKIEAVCYNIHVRGTEVPQHMLGHITITDKYDDDDEGYVV